MQATCPNCGYTIDFREHSRSKDLREILEIWPVFGREARLVFEYCELFGVSPVSLKTKKLLRLLREMAELWRSGKFRFGKQTLEISQAGIAEALKEVCNRKFTAALTNHNYLKKVMLSIAERERKEVSKSAEKDLREREEKLKSGLRPDRADANVNEVKSLLKNLGSRRL